jgi:hypothetical protein
MTHFEFLSVALSFVLGLAVTVLLTSVLNAFRARRETRMNWIPLSWAAYILVAQFDVWWEVYGLVSLESWSAGAFVLLLLLALLLFMAGGLILPARFADYPDDLDDYFQKDGRWAVAIVGAFIVTGIVANVVLFDIGIFDAMNVWNLVGIAITAMVFGASRRVTQSVGTIAFGVFLAIYIWAFVPATY